MRRLDSAWATLTLLLCSATIAIASSDTCASEVCAANSPCAAAEAYVAQGPQRGMHILCTQPQQSGKAATLTLYIDSTSSSADLEVDLSSWQQLASSITAWLSDNGSSGSKMDRWAIFTATGDKITTTEALREAPVSFLITGGNFVWPAVREGFTQPVRSDRSISLETLSLRPLVFRVHNLLSDEEVQYIQEQSLPHMAASTVSKHDSDAESPDTKWRISETYFLRSDNRPIIQQIDQRIADVTGVPQEHQESVQVLRYVQGGKYDAHHDYFDPSLYQTQPATLEMLHHGDRNRFLTVLWYLHNVTEGGETVFPRAGGAPQPASMRDCTKGLLVKPIKGTAVIFYNMYPSGELDPHSLHGACPVKDGVKWAANKWVWNKPVEFGPGPKKRKK